MGMSAVNQAVGVTLPSTLSLLRWPMLCLHPLALFFLFHANKCHPRFMLKFLHVCFPLCLYGHTPTHHTQTGDHTHT
eukprot:m.162318 g.162318  ORF g.162318 m.162318 type:complete len:77 (-) comp18064_c0_seq32:352-582(-)